VSVDYAKLAQDAAERRLDALDQLEFDGTPLPDDIEVLAPYCGCRTCLVREVLDAAWPHLLALARDEVAVG
jgi:hypothetical protein